MNEFTEMLSNFWILKEYDSADYFRIKRAADNQLKNFLTEFVGWKLFINNDMIKLEKLPAEAQPFMGIQDFYSVNDYCLLCALLIYLDEKIKGTHFLLSELIESVEKIAAGYIDIDLTRFSDRKSLIRVLRFAEQIHLLKVSDGSLDDAEKDRTKEILYENTGSSAYFSVSHDSPINEYESIRDFEESSDLYTDTSLGNARTNRVYRRLLLQPAMYWEDNDDMDSLYLKNRRASINKYLDKYVGGRLDIHNGAAFYMLSEDDTFGDIHPSNGSLSGFVTLMCGELKNEISAIELNRQRHKYYFSESELASIIEKYRAKFSRILSKEFKEKSIEKFKKEVTEYMLKWQLAERTDAGYLLCDGIFKTAGHFPKDMKEG